ncbi:hypothetical protein JD79_04044 [Geodermatophilus normandii]|uniref:DUF222 domain-containing protein n=1 Tax=Geodermatophilus normandii TaxID=1137989 RepID=A0A317QPC9_9ACTN|nr:hypothetical protein [Geodermatophilus normandii]PWW24853.1 hypothetical protein JD79_04044 [Geodermatophilus normandii]
MRGFGVVQEVTGSLVERALAGWLVEQPAPIRRVPVALLSREQKAAELQRLQARKAMDAAHEAELILGLADESPDDDDPPPGTPGARSWKPDPELPGVSESFPAELAVVLNCGRLSAGQLAHRAWTYRTHLPATWAAMSAGQLDEYRAGTLLLELDAAAADRRREQARRRADARVYPAPQEGMATLAADLPVEVPAACHALVDQLARLLEADGDPRPIGDCARWCSPICSSAPGTSPARR